jgi:transposase
MSRHTAQFKRSVVKDLLSGKGGSSRDVAYRHGIDHGTVRRWAAAWQERGEDAFRKKYSRYDARFKLKVLRAMLSKDLSGRQAAALFDIRNPAVIGIWKRQYDSGGIEALQPRPRGRPVKPPKSSVPSDSTKSDESRTKEELLEELNYLRMENAYLKKLDALIRSERLEAPRKKRK